MPAERSIAINPLFGDVLGTWFITPSDPENAHTLGRLAFEAVELGEKIDIPSTPPAESSFRYAPSWANGVESVAVCDIVKAADKNVLPVAMIRELRLHAGVHWLKITHVIDPDDTESVKVTNSFENLQGTFPLLLGPGLDSNSGPRRCIRRNADRFFSLLAPQRPRR
jgi:hypothetical protein